MNKKVSFIGTGMMGQSLIKGFVKSGFDCDLLMASNRSVEKLQKLEKEFSIHVTLDNLESAAFGDYVFIAVSNQNLLDVLSQIRNKLKKDAIVISMASGIELKTMKAVLGSDRIIRIMPNTPCFIQKGTIGLVNASDLDISDIIKLLQTVGRVEQIDENLMSAFVGIAGSSPAYIFMLIEAMADGGVKEGLPRALAYRLAAQTVMGSAALVLETNTHPAVLKDQVTSPGGTTIAAIQSLEQSGFRAAMIDAIAACVAKDRELGKK